MDMTVMDGLCRDTLGSFNESVFALWTCSLCYSYLFPNGHFKPSMNPDKPSLIPFSNPGENLTSYNAVYPDINREMSVKMVCNSLDGKDCQRWKSCCRSAIQCCVRQLTMQSKLQNGDILCPRTWDGWGCFDDTSPFQTVSIRCPSFIKYGNEDGYAYKECTENGTWARNPESGREWTDYRQCVDIQGYQGVVYVGAICSIISLLLLIPACVIFLWFRQLRTQQRIKLHISLFASFILTAILTLIWDIRVYGDRLCKPVQEAFMTQFEGTCKTIYFLWRYARCTNYYWMFCEGFYLHQLIVHAFQSPKRMVLYYVLAWAIGMIAAALGLTIAHFVKRLTGGDDGCGDDSFIDKFKRGIPLVPLSVYSIVRATVANDRCWIKNAGAYELIIYAPNLLCIVVNFIFLLSILRILLTQLHAHPNEPSNFRRALKATFVLVPLFGLQLFLIIYRPVHVAMDTLYIFEIISKLVIDSQGAVIALIFCYFNGEVMQHLSISCRRLLGNQEKGGQNYTMATTYGIASPMSVQPNSTDNKKEYIPMMDVDDNDSYCNNV